ncbi:hypothetical protein Hanom_Chr10g00948111 [Helianthus anomalus]
MPKQLAFHQTPRVQPKLKDCDAQRLQNKSKKKVIIPKISSWIVSRRVYWNELFRWVKKRDDVPLVVVRNFPTGQHLVRFIVPGRHVSGTNRRGSPLHCNIQASTCIKVSIVKFQQVVRRL